MTTYPPEPWHLGGELLVSAFLVPTREVPGARLPDGRRPIRWGRRALVGVAFIHYAAGGVLQYEELLVALQSLPGPVVTIPLIWVDSAESRAGGRELWSIPKELGRFARQETPAGASVALDGIARLDADVGSRLVPGMPRLPLTTLQSHDGRRVLSRNHVLGRIRRMRPRWTFDPDGPLAFLANRRPVFSVAIRDASITFGLDVER